MKNITIIGAGLVGTLCSLYLAKRGYKIVIYEARKDPRKTELDAGRSINLAMSCRGLTALLKVDLLDEVKKLMVPMRGRAIHEEDGKLVNQPFGRHSDEYINAIQRTDLNNLLLNEAEKTGAIQIFFDTSVQAMDFKKRCLQLKRNQEKFLEPWQLLIAADGAGSIVREALQQNNLVHATRTFLSHGYKELSLSKNNGHFAKEQLHLWPRASFLLLGNPNLDGSLTGSLFMPNEGKVSFSALNTETKIHHFFQEQFKDAYDSMPELLDEMLHHPVGNMSTVQCAPWYHEDNCLLIGDAAHGIVPFFGQGMNCGFEDCRILNKLLDEYKDDWHKVLPVFNKERKENTEAVAQMSMDNYHEIHEDIRDAEFILKKKLELALMKKYPSIYQSKHVLVMFTNTSYADAAAIGMIQQNLLNKILCNKRELEGIDWQSVDKMMGGYEKSLMNLRK